MARIVPFVVGGMPTWGVRPVVLQRRFFAGWMRRPPARYVTAPARRLPVPLPHIALASGGPGLSKTHGIGSNDPHGSSCGQGSSTVCLRCSIAGPLTSTSA